MHFFKTFTDDLFRYDMLDFMACLSAHLISQAEIQLIDQFLNFYLRYKK